VCSYGDLNRSRGRIGGRFAEGFIFGFFGFKSVSLGHFNLVVLLEATNEAGSSRTPAFSVSKTQRSRDRNQRFCFQAHSSLWSAKHIMIPFVLIVSIVLGGFWRESVGCQACRGAAICAFAEGFAFDSRSFKQAILVKFELLMIIQAAKHAGTSSVPVSAILEGGSHVTKIIGFHAILQVALVLGYWILLY
jgi:hypothetical protein